MSAYLQRLVSTALTPNTGARPVLGSLFSSSINEGAVQGPQEIQEIEEVVVSRPYSAAGHVPAPEQTVLPRAESTSSDGDFGRFRPDQTVLPRTESTLSAFDSGRSPTLAVADEASERGKDSQLPSHPNRPFTPVVAHIPEAPHSTLKANGLAPASDSNPTSEPPEIRSRRALDSPQQRHEIKLEEKSTHVAQSSRGTLREGAQGEITLKDVRNGGQVRLEKPHEQVLSPAREAPLLVESFRRAETEFGQPTAPLSSRRMAGVTSHQNKARQKQEADEIQIHIGRIEITAMPPAPVRPVAPPVPKSLKLDEYLRRGRGSS